MIEWDKSAKLNKMGINELKMWFKKYPSSGKRIIVICEGCNKEREIYFNAYRELCKHCAMKQESTIEKLRDAANSQWSVSGVREAHSDYMKQAFIDGDERFEKQGKSLKRFFKENPDKLKEMSKRAKQYHIDHPEVAEYHSRVMIENYKDTEYRKRASEVRIEYLKDHPEFSVRMSEIVKNSPAHHDASQAKVGGYDIVMHHWLYDDADLSKYTMPMTRSEHTAMHWRMRADGYEVARINSRTDDNGLWGYL